MLIYVYLQYRYTHLYSLTYISRTIILIPGLYLGRPLVEDRPDDRGGAVGCRWIWKVLNG